MTDLEELQTMTRSQLAAIAVGRMPPFKPELREKVRRLEKTQTRRAPVTGKARYYDGVRFLIEPLTKGTAESVAYPVARYKDDNALAVDMNGDLIQWRWSKDTLSSIHMPNEAARFFVNWRHRGIEHVQDITEEDAKAEGVTASIVGAALDSLKYKSAFQTLWNKINADRDGLDWDSNPYVHVYEWEPIVRKMWSYPVIEVSMPEYTSFTVIDTLDEYRKGPNGYN